MRACGEGSAPMRCMGPILLWDGGVAKHQEGMGGFFQICET
jgi:hypothetical protein